MKLNLDRQTMEDKYGNRIVIYSNSNKEEISVKLKEMPYDCPTILYDRPK